MTWTCRVMHKAEALQALRQTGLLTDGEGSYDLLHLAEKVGTRRVLQVLGCVPLLPGMAQTPTGLGLAAFLTFCPVCGAPSHFLIAGPAAAHANPGRPSWIWNQDEQRPTLSPSLKWITCPGHYTLSAGVLSGGHTG